MRLLRRSADSLVVGIRQQSALVFGATSFLLACASTVRAFRQLFSTYAAYDDTGFFLTLFQHFNARGRLYGETFSQYGPFLSEFYFLIGRVLHVPLTQDGIRWVVLVLWIVCSVLAGLVAYRVTSSIWIGLLIQALSFQPLDVLTAEPGHPISLCALLLAGLAYALTAGDGERLGKVQGLCAGALLAALTLTKINLGLFAFAAVGTALVFCLPGAFLSRMLRWLVGAIFCLLAIVLVKPLWPAETRFTFLSYFLCMLVAVLVSARFEQLPWRTVGRFGLSMFAGITITSGLCIALTIFTGTGWSALLDGLLVRPLTLGNSFTAPPGMPPQVAKIAVLSVTTACGWRLLAPRSEYLYQQGCLFLRLLLAALFAGSLLRVCGPWTPYCFVWISVLRSEKIESASAQFGRLGLVVLAVSQFLGVYPVCGAQVGIPFFLGSLCLMPALGALLEGPYPRRDSSVMPRLGFVLAAAFMIATTLATATGWTIMYQYAKRRYRHTVALDLPGTSLLRVERGTATTYRCLAENLRASAPSFITIPGMNSLYGWAERPLPVASNPTTNFALLSRPEQQQMVAVGRSCRPIPLVRNEYLLYDFWARGRFTPTGPLIDFMNEECRSVGRTRGYDLMCLKSERPPILTYCARLGGEGPNGLPPEISITLPARYADAKQASVLNLSKPKHTPERCELRERPAHQNPHSLAPDVRQFVFQRVTRRGLTPGNLDNYIVQIWDSRDRLLTELPLLSAPEPR